MKVKIAPVLTGLLWGSNELTIARAQSGSQLAVRATEVSLVVIPRELGGWASSGSKAPWAAREMCRDSGGQREKRGKGEK